MGGAAIRRGFRVKCLRSRERKETVKRMYDRIRGKGSDGIRDSEVDDVSASRN